MGLARHIGVSNFTVALIEEAVAACPEPLVCDQVEYHPYLDQTKVREACARHGMALVAYSPIAKGRIKNDRRAAADRRRAHRKTRGAGLPALAGAAERGGDPADLELERLSENIEIFDFELSDEDMSEDLRPGQRQRPAHRLRFRAEMGLRNCRAGRYAVGRGAFEHSV